MLRLYLDESNQEQVGSFTVAGYVFDPLGARRLEEPWRQALDSARLPRFRMSEFENRQGPYAAWSDEYRHAFLNQLISIIHKTARFQVAVAVDLEAFEVLAPSVQSMLPDLTPYTLAVVTTLSDVAQATGGTEPIAYVLDQIPKGRTNVIDVFDFVLRDQRRGRRPAYNFTSLTSADSTLVPHLQAADMLAYESAKEAARAFGRSVRPVRESGRRLVTGGGMTVPVGRLFTAEALRAYFERVCEGTEVSE